MTAHVQEQLSAFMDGALPAAELSAVQEHVRVCPSCARLLEELTVVDHAARELPVDAPAAYFDTFAGRVRERLEAERRPVRARAVPPWAWAVAAGLLLAVVTPLTVLRAPQTPRLTDLVVPPGAAKEEGPRSAAASAAPDPAAPAPSRAPSTARSEAEGARGRTEAPKLRKDVAPSPPRQAAAAPPPALREEDAPKQTVPAPVGADEQKAQAASPPVLEERQAAREQKGTTALEFAEAGAAKDDERASADRETRDQVGARAAGAVAPFAQEPSPAPAPKRARLRGSADGSRTADTAAAPGLGLEAEYARLQRRTATDVGTARALREAWRNFGLRNPDSPYADEARVGTIAAGVEAVRLGGDADDRERLDRDAASYLERDESKQKERVRRILKQLDRDEN